MREEGGLPCEGGGEDYLVREEGRTTLGGRRGGLPCEGLGEDYLV